MLIAGFLSNSFVDWRGKIVATIFTYGCNFRCPFCHNYSLVTERSENYFSPEIILEQVEELSSWIDGVCITGGEPTIHIDLPDFIKELHRITRVKLDTNGTNPEILKESMPYLSYVAMDIKAPRYRYEELAGVKVNMDNIEESISVIMKEARDYEFRTTAVPVLTHGDFEEIAKWIKGARRYVIQQYSTGGGTLNPEYTKLKPYHRAVLKNICDSVNDMVGECLVVNL